MPGPAPKDPSQRARRNKDVVPMRVVEVRAFPQPELPDSFEWICNGEPTSIPIPAETHRWWAMWGASPLTAEYTDTDWDELRITARVHARMELGDTQAEREYRLRGALFGATPVDRARLRIAFNTADASDKPSKAAASGAAERRRARAASS